MGNAMNLKKIKKSDKEDILEYVSHYPHKDLQRRAQGFDPKKTAEYHTRRILDLSEKHEGYIGREKNGNISGLCVIQSRQWHSSIFGMKMCKLSPFLLFKGSQASRKKFIDSILVKIKTKKYEHVELRVDVNEWGNVALLEEKGFHFVDCSIKMYINLETGRLTEPKAPQGPYKIVTGCTDAQIEQIKEISKLAHQYNHFFSDTTLDVKNAHELFGEWIEKCCRHLACKIIVALHRDNVMGFAIILANRELNQKLKRNIAILDFIAVDPTFQGKGVGRWLLNETLVRLRRDDEFEQVELRTSINNYPALNLYSTNGFFFVAADTILTRRIA